MKIQRSHFRLVTLFLLCAFVATVLLCSVHVGLITPPVLPGNEEGNITDAEESFNQPDDVPVAEDPVPSPAVFPPEEYVTIGL